MWCAFDDFFVSSQWWMRYAKVFQKLPIGTEVSIICHRHFSEVSHALEFAVVSVIFGRAISEHIKIVTAVPLMTDQMSACTTICYHLCNKEETEGSACN
jgi:hypothetical protein